MTETTSLTLRIVPVKSAPGTEFVTVANGKITYGRFILDRLPFDIARDAAR